MNKNYIKHFKLILSWAKLVFTPIAIAFLVYFFWESRQEFKHTFQSSTPAWLLASIGLWLLLHFISPLFTIFIFNRWNIHLTYRNILWIHSSRLPAKYIPGGIWHSVARATDYYNVGIDKRHIASYLIIENIIVAAVTLSLGGIFAIKIIEDQFWIKLIQTLIICSISIILLLPWLIEKHLKTKVVSPLLPYFYGICLILFYWIVAAFSFICFLMAFPKLNLQLPLFISGGIYVFSWGIGFIALFAPQGIGVSEFICSKLLVANISSAHFIALLASFRLVGLLGDLSMYGLIILTHTKNR